MAEEKQDKKKPTSIREILRWILCGLLGLLLIAALIVQAPGKIVTLLVVFVLGCAALPKGVRRWFWLCTAAAAIGLAAWIFVPDSGDDWEPHTFAEEIGALQAGCAIPDEENAATVYNRLLEDYDPAEMKLTFLDPGQKSITLSQPWLSDAYPNVALWLQERQELIAELLRASEMQECRLPLNFDLVITNRMELNRYPSLQSWAAMLLRAGNNDMAEGRIGQAVTKYIGALRIAGHLYQQQQMVDFLIGFGIESITLRPLNRFVVQGQANEEQLQRISQSLENLKNTWSSDFRKCLDYDKLFAKNAFCTLAYQRNLQGKVRLSRNPIAAIRYGFRRMTPQTYWQKTSTKASAMLAWWFLPATPGRAARMIDTHYEKYYQMAEPDFDWQQVHIDPVPRFRPNSRFVIRMLTDNTTRLYRPFHETYLRRLALRRGSRLLVAIRQYQIEHNAWPDDLGAIRAVVPAEALIDPVTANEFEYENHGEYFSLKAESADIWPK
jgi:hypothetical protein